MTTKAEEYLVATVMIGLEKPTLMLINHAITMNKKTMHNGVSEQESLSKE